MNSRLYVGNLCPSVTESELRLLFSRAGAITKIELMLDTATRQPRGFAFITMANPEMAAAALREFHCYSLGGRHIKVTEARPPQELKGMMSEGFDCGSSAPFRPPNGRGPASRQSSRPPRHRARRR